MSAGIQLSNPNSKIYVYLAGPINGCTDDEANGWRQKFQELHQTPRVVNGFNQGPKYGFVDPMRRDYRGKELLNPGRIVKGDIADIDFCSVFVAYCWQTSWGTAMEIFYAKQQGKEVLLIVPEGARLSPWLAYHSDGIYPTIESVELP